MLAERGLKRRRAGLAGLSLLKLGAGVVVEVARAGDGGVLERVGPRAELGRITLANPAPSNHLRSMSVTEIKAQADVLSFEDIGDLARYFRALALRKDPQRRTQLQAAQQSADWLTQAEFERALAQRDQAGR